MLFRGALLFSKQGTHVQGQISDTVCFFVVGRVYYIRRRQILIVFVYAFS